MIKLLTHTAILMIVLFSVILLFGDWGVILSVIGLFVALTIINVRSVNE
jgi:hypothetical protein